MGCEWLYVEQGAVVGSAGSGNPCRMRPGRDPAAARARAVPPHLPWLGRVAGRGWIALAPIGVEPAPLLTALLGSIPSWAGAARGERPRSSLVDPHHAGARLGGWGLGFPVPFHP